MEIHGNRQLVTLGRRVKAPMALMLFAIALATCLNASDRSVGNPGRNAPGKETTAAAALPVADADAMRIQGEQRYHANCGRCHAAPEKFPPRMMKTVLRHMRVRATITDQDMRLILFYMTQ